MIQLVIPWTKDFWKETFLLILEFLEEEMRQSGELARVETTFSALNVWPNLSRSVSTRGEFSSSSRSKEDKKTEKGITFLERREKYVKKIFKCWTSDEYGHFASKFPKREKRFRGKFKPRRHKDRNWLYANEDREYDKNDWSESDDELGFVAIKNDNLDREIREERDLVTQV